VLCYFEVCKWEKKSSFCEIAFKFLLNFLWQLLSLLMPQRHVACHVGTLFCAENSRLDELIFNSRNLGVPCVLRFHPYESHLAVADKDHVRSDCMPLSMWNLIDSIFVCIIIIIITAFV